VVGIVALVRYVAGPAHRKLAAARAIAFSLLWLIALWRSATDNFASFAIEPFTVLTAILPSLCVAHFVAVALRKSRSVEP
jgi:hypothetical protein